MPPPPQHYFINQITSCSKSLIGKSLIKFISHFLRTHACSVSAELLLSRFRKGACCSFSALLELPPSMLWSPHAHTLVTTPLHQSLMLSCDLLLTISIIIRDCQENSITAGSVMVLCAVGDFGNLCDITCLFDFFTYYFLLLILTAPFCLALSCLILLYYPIMHLSPSVAQEFHAFLSD